MPEAAKPVEAPPPAPRRYEIPVFAEETVKPEAPPSEPPQPAEGGEPAQDTGEQAPPAPSEGDKPKEDVTPEQAAKREGRRFERKLDKAYRQRAEAQARAELLEKRLTELQQPKAPPGAPTLEQNDFDPEKYATAKAEYAKIEAAKEFETRQRQQAQQQEIQRLSSAWEEKVERAEDKYDDFNEVVGKLEPNSFFTAAIMDAENGEDIAYYLGKNIAEATRISKLGLAAQGREIGKLEAKLLAEAAKPKAPSKAPAPITPLSGAANVATDEPSEQDDYATWVKKRNRQLGRKV